VFASFMSPMISNTILKDWSDRQRLRFCFGYSNLVQIGAVDNASSLAAAALLTSLNLTRFDVARTRTYVP
jgi:hypothetical protein